jgi:hypothetical protein
MLIRQPRSTLGVDDCS